MGRIRGWLLGCGLFASVAHAACAQDVPDEKGAFGPIVIGDSLGRPRAVYRPSYDGPFNRQLDKLGAKMRAAGMQGGLPPLYYPASGSGFGYYGFGYGSGFWNREFMSPLYHPVGASTEPGPYYSPAVSSSLGTPSPAAAAKGWGYSPPWSKAYREGQPRRSIGHLFHRHQD